MDAGKPTVLLAEDFVELRSLLRRVLESAGCAVVAAADGAAALEAAGAAGPVDLLVADMRMPRLGGLELVRRLRVSRPGLKVLFISTVGPGNEDLADACPGAQFLPKPFGPDKFAEKVLEMLGGRRGA